MTLPPDSDATPALLRLRALSTGGDALLYEAADEIEHLQLCIRDLNGILNEKRAEIERLRADAERYRWLEEHCTSENDNGDKCLVFWCDFENYNDVDAAIDAARAALKEPT